MIKLNNKP
jgi:hypothetical protein